MLTKFLKIAMLHVVLDWQQTYKTVLEKAFFLSFWRFYLLPPKKVKIKKRKKIRLSKIRKQFF
jgi:hypothetical protein